MSEKDTLYKGRAANVVMTPDEIEAIFGRGMKINSVKVVTEEVYAERLSASSACPDLQFGTFCKYCTCRVQVRAKLAASKCPHPYAPKW